jgi:tetratricopeptide (TPR) repeat protein
VKHQADELRLLSQLLDEFTELPEHERASWLNGLTGEAARLRPSFSRMIARQTGSELDQFLERPPEIAVAETEAPASDFSGGDRIGPYRLLRPIGRGGMGEVWLATRSDGQLKRSVALKLPVLSVRRSVLVQRFERERDILGALIHPHIARLYDAGVADDGQPFMALEYVEGTPITEAADERSLDARGRVRLLRQVMDAVQYAHAKLVIHRDLKPANVLVTGEGEAKLLDFGIAKLVEDEAGATTESELTRLGGRALTLRYAAPELIGGGSVGTGADVWALGVLLYELLTGLRPFDGDGGIGIEQQILQRDPVRPSQVGSGVIARLSRSLAADLDTITLMALKKDPAGRYATVGAFADDLDRWLRGEPVRAQRDSGWYRARRFVGRNRLAVGAATLAGAALVGTASVAVVLGLQAREDSARAMAARDFMIDIFLQTDLDLSPGQEMSAKQLLIRGYQTVVDTMQGQPLLQTELLLGIGDALDFMEDLGPADKALQQAALAYQGMGRPREAAHTTLARAAMRYYNRWETAAAADLMAQAMAMHPAPDSDDEFMARYAIDRAVAAGIAGDQREEKAWYARAGPHADRSLRDNNTQTVMAVRALARLDGKYRAYDKGTERLNVLLERLRQDRRARPAWIVGALDDLGQIEFSAGRYRAALERFDATHAYCQKSSDPRGIQCLYTQYQRAMAMHVLGYTQRALETVPLLLDRSRITESSAGFATRFTRQAFQVLLANGQLDRHPAVAAEVQALGESISDDEWLHKLPFLLVQVRLLIQEGRLDAAQDLSRRAQALLARRGLDSLSSTEAFVLEGYIAQALGRDQRALEILDGVHGARAAVSGADHPLTQLVSVHRARSLWALGRGAEALALIDQALPILRPALGVEAPTLVRIEALRAELASTEPGAPAVKRSVELFL